MRGKKKFIKFFVAAFIVFLVGYLGMNYVLDNTWMQPDVSEAEDIVPVLVDPNSAFFEAFRDSDKVNILVLGVNQELTDTIMLVSCDLSHNKLDVISVPRDVYYPRDGVTSTAAKKLNAVYRKGRAVGTATAVSDILLGMPINYYAVIDYDGVTQIVDSMGGVPMNIPFRMKYTDKYDTPPLYIDIPAGEQQLDGENAVKFLRFRKADKGYQGYPGGDIGRIKAQQEFMKSAFNQALSYRLPAVASSVVKNVESNITLRAASSLATKASNLTSDSVTTYTLPGTDKTIDGLSFYLVDSEKISTMLSEIYSLNDDENIEEIDEIQ